MRQRAKLLSVDSVRMSCFEMSRRTIKFHSVPISTWPEFTGESQSCFINYTPTQPILVYSIASFHALVILLASSFTLVVTFHCVLFRYRRPSSSSWHVNSYVTDLVMRPCSTSRCSGTAERWEDQDCFVGRKNSAANICIIAGDTISFCDKRPSPKRTDPSY